MASIEGKYSLRRTRMMGISRMIVLLIIFVVVKSHIFLHHTNDGWGIEQYDCVFVQSSSSPSYCRRPREPFDRFQRDDDATRTCVQNGGEIYMFSELRSKNITINTLQHHWTTNLQQLEEYSLYLRDLRLSDGHLCRCVRLGTFGMACEYQLPVGKTLEETLQWQLIMRNVDQESVQVHGDIVCYETLECESGVLCLDWRDICDGIQQCMEGKDEENCDLLEMNQCDPEEEYRCTNGMCIPDQFFLDGEFDCLDWSDEMPFKDSKNCPRQSVTTECDDHLCPSIEWSCGDGQCIGDRLNFQKSAIGFTCLSGRDQYSICETHLTQMQWTMPDGRCCRGGGYEASRVANHSDEEICEYLLKCALSVGEEIGCPCDGDSGCAEELARVCRLSLIQYPRGAVVTPYTLFFYNRSRDWPYRWAEFILINGTMRCRGENVF